MSDIAICPQCDLRQFRREKCRRCGHQIPQKEVIEKLVEVPKIVEKRVEVPIECVACTVMTDDFPTMEVMGRRLLVRAYQRSEGNVEKMCDMLGLSKTTVYRQVRLMRDAGELPELAK